MRTRSISHLSIGFEIGENVLHAEQMGFTDEIRTTSGDLFVIAMVLIEDSLQVSEIVQVGRYGTN